MPERPQVPKRRQHIKANLNFGPEYLIPKPFDPRLSVVVPTAVAQAAMKSGVAKPIPDLESYKDKLKEGVFKSALLMRPVFETAKR